jgi:hypothetical protein
MYSSIQKTYKPIIEMYEEDRLINSILILREPEGPSAVGPLTVTQLITWEDMRYFWKMAVSRIYNPWRAYLIAALMGQEGKREAAKQQTSIILEELAQELDKKYPNLIFQFLIATPAGTVRSNGGTLTHNIFALLGIAESFTGKNLCTTRNYDEQTKTLADFFTSGLSYFNKYSGTSYSHVLQIVIARKN